MPSKILFLIVVFEEVHQLCFLEETVLRRASNLIIVLLMVWFLLSIRNNDENCFLKVFSKLKTLLMEKGDSLFICFFCNLHLNFTSYYKI